MSYLDEVDQKIDEIFNSRLTEDRLYSKIKTLIHEELIRSFKNGMEIGRKTRGKISQSKRTNKK